MAQLLQHTDAYILREFAGDVKHIITGTVTPEAQREIARLGLPHLRALQRNGHDMDTIKSLMRSAVGLPAQKM